MKLITKVIIKMKITLNIVKNGLKWGEKINPPILELPMDETENKIKYEVKIPKKEAKKE